MYYTTAVAKLDVYIKLEQLQRNFQEDQIYF